MTETAEPRRCRKARNRPISFDCKLDAGHEGGCTPYTLRPSTEWVAAQASMAQVALLLAAYDGTSDEEKR